MLSPIKHCTQHYNTTLVNVNSYFRGLVTFILTVLLIYECTALDIYWCNPSLLNLALTLTSHLPEMLPPIKHCTQHYNTTLVNVNSYFRGFVTFILTLLLIYECSPLDIYWHNPSLLNLALTLTSHLSEMLPPIKHCTQHYNTTLVNVNSYFRGLVTFILTVLLIYEYTALDIYWHNPSLLNLALTLTSHLPKMLPPVKHCTQHYNTTLVNVNSYFRGFVTFILTLLLIYECSPLDIYWHNPSLLNLALTLTSHLPEMLSPIKHCTQHYNTTLVNVNSFFRGLVTFILTVLLIYECTALDIYWHNPSLLNLALTLTSHLSEMLSPIKHCTQHYNTTLVNVNSYFRGLVTFIMTQLLIYECDTLGNSGFQVNWCHLGN